MTDEYVETSRQGWLSRLGESIRGVVVGLLLFLAGCPVLWCNEGRAVQTYKGLQEGSGRVISVPPTPVAPANEGALVHTTALATTDERLEDPQFGVGGVALRLRRVVETYQWVEKVSTEKKRKLGGGEETVKRYTYRQEWRSGLVDSSGFKKAAEHRNPTEAKYENASWEAARVTVGGFDLSPGLRQKLNRWEPLTLDDAVVTRLNGPPNAGAAANSEVAPAKRRRKGRKGRKARLRRKAKAVAVAPADYTLGNNQLYFRADPQAPEVGDTRIRFEQVMPTEVSVVAQQQGSNLQPYPTEAGMALELLTPGRVSAAGMFQQAEQANVFVTWLLRVVGFFMLFGGVFMVFRPLAVVADVVPMFGDILRVGTGLVALLIAGPVSLLTIALAWLFYRPLLGLGLLIVGAGVFWAVRRFGKRRAAALPSPAPA